MKHKLNIITLVSKPFRLYTGLPRDIYILFFARLVNSMGHFVFPFLTLLLTEKLGFSPGAAGKWILIATFSSVPGMIAGGKLADIIGRKKILLISHLLSAAFFLPCAFMGNSVTMVWFLLGSFFFLGAARPVMMALTTDITTPDNRQAAFSFLYLGHNIGFAVGPLIAGFLFNKHLHLIFLGDAVTTFIAAVLILLFVGETLPTEEDMQRAGDINPEERAEKGSFLKALLRRPFLLAFMFIIMLLNFVYGQYEFSLPLQLNYSFGADGAKFFGIVMTFNAISVTILTTPVITLTKRNPPVFNQCIAGLLYAVGFGMIFFLKAFWPYLISVIIWTTGEVISVTNTGAYIANHTPSSHRGRFNSITPLIMGAGFAVSPVIIGGYIESHSLRDVWILVFWLALICTIMLFILGIVEKSIKAGTAKRGYLNSLEE